VTREEFETGLKKEFAAMDRNADGRLDRAELLMQVGRPQASDGSGQRPPGGGQGGGSRGGGRHRPY
jgi:hypothetical protein